MLDLDAPILAYDYESTPRNVKSLIDDVKQFKRELQKLKRRYANIPDSTSIFLVGDATIFDEIKKQWRSTHSITGSSWRALRRIRNHCAAQIQELASCASEIDAFYASRKPLSRVHKYNFHKL